MWRNPGMWREISDRVRPSDKRIVSACIMVPAILGVADFYLDLVSGVHLYRSRVWYLQAVAEASERFRRNEHAILKAGTWRCCTPRPSATRASRGTPSS